MASLPRQPVLIGPLAFEEKDYDEHGEVCEVEFKSTLRKRMRWSKGVLKLMAGYNGGLENNWAD